jgi:predicted transcriptional regulator
VIIPQFVELPHGDRYFTISQTTNRPEISRET